MNFSTSHPEISLRFCIEEDAIGTLEGVLATARRIGAELRNLRAGIGTHGLEVWMRLAAADANALVLCRTRMRNIVGVANLIDLGDLGDCIDAAAAPKQTVAVAAMRDAALLDT